MKIQKVKNLFNKGFTLIELLVVIAVLGVLAAAIIAAIDPVEKIAQANDSRVKGDINNIAKAVELYATQNDGAYPTQAQLTAPGKSDLKGWPAPPAATYDTYVLTRYTTPQVGVIITGQLKAKANKAGTVAANNTYYFYDTANARGCAIGAAAAPTVTTSCP